MEKTGTDLYILGWLAIKLDWLKVKQNVVCLYINIYNKKKYA